MGAHYLEGFPAVIAVLVSRRLQPPENARSRDHSRQVGIATEMQLARLDCHERNQSMLGR